MVVILLVGAPGSGKSTYCSKKLPTYFRINQDEQGKKRHWQIYLKAIEEKIPEIVIDRINHTQIQREKYISIAKQNNYLTKIVHLDVPYTICLERILKREDHPTISSLKVAKIALGSYFSLFEPILKLEADQITTVS